jgi:NitT/TauT family transport system ATP-binding protein
MSTTSPSPTNDAILVADDIGVRFETAEGPVIAVDDISFKVRHGEFLSVIGPSGCGKSTLFNVIGGLLSQHRGVVTVAGETISGPHKNIGMVFQEESTFPWRTVVDNVAFPLELIGMPKAKRVEKARHFIALVGLDGFENRYPGELSGGMRQRVSLAAALLHQPDLLLLDEPTVGVDPLLRQEFWTHFRALAQQGVTILVSSHVMDEASRCDRLGLIRAGRVLAEGTAAELTGRAGAKDLESAFLSLAGASGSVQTGNGTGS